MEEVLLVEIKSRNASKANRLLIGWMKSQEFIQNTNKIKEKEFTLYTAKSNDLDEIKEVLSKSTLETVEAGDKHNKIIEVVKLFCSKAENIEESSLKIAPQAVGFVANNDHVVLAQAVSNDKEEIGKTIIKEELKLVSTINKDQHSNNNIGTADEGPILHVSAGNSKEMIGETIEKESSELDNKTILPVKVDDENAGAKAGGSSLKGAPTTVEPASNDDDAVPQPYINSNKEKIEEPIAIKEEPEPLQIVINNDEAIALTFSLIEQVLNIMQDISEAQENNMILELMQQQELLENNNQIQLGDTEDASYGGNTIKDDLKEPGAHILPAVKIDKPFIERQREEGEQDVIWKDIAGYYIGENHNDLGVLGNNSIEQEWTVEGH